MKTLLTSKTIIALAVAVAASAANISNAYEQPIPPPASPVGMPAIISPDSGAGQVVKLVQSGVNISTITTFIANCSGPFSLDASKIIALNDAGVPSNVIDAMLAHDRNLDAIAQAQTPTATPVTVTTVETAPPPAVTVNYFYDTLSPYGSWVDVAGYGRCWRPTTVVYDTNWRPYCDRGHWVYTDCGWYWDSDYAWGATFHYGRWFRDERFGWCWWPDTDWAPSWVLWRSGGEYCGWAPLPPRCLFRREGGFFFNGSSIAVGFDFGFDADYFVFVGSDHFCDRRLHDYREDHRHVGEFFHNTTIVNNYNFDSSHHTVFNGGISPERLSAASHHPIRPISVSELPNAARQGWRGDIGGHAGASDVWQHTSRLDQQRERAQQGGYVAQPQGTLNAQQQAVLQPDRLSRVDPRERAPQNTLNAKQQEVLQPNQFNHSSRLEQQRNQTAAYADVQRPQNFVAPQPVARPVQSQSVLAPQMEQRLPRQLDNHVYQAPNHPAPNFERAENRYQPAVQPVQPQHVEHAPTAGNSGNGKGKNNP